MKAVFRKESGKVDITATADIAAGDVIQLGSRVGIALSDAKGGELIAVRTNGQFEVAKDTAAIGANAAVYWDTTAKAATATSGTGTIPLGTSTAPALAGDGTVLVDINV